MPKKLFQKGHKINMGRIPWNKGKKLPFKPRPWQRGKAPWNKGKHTGNYGNGFKKGHIAWNKGKNNKIKIKCLICGKEKEYKPSCIKYGLGKYCSRKCCNKSLIGHPDWLNKEARKKISNALRGKYIEEKSWNWKGDNVGYVGLHMWVKRWLGKPTKCELCGKEGLMGREIHWANKSGLYFRDLSDWFRLCVKCHREFDKKQSLSNIL